MIEGICRYCSREAPLTPDLQLVAAHRDVRHDEPCRGAGWIPLEPAVSSKAAKRSSAGVGRAYEGSGFLDALHGLLLGAGVLGWFFVVAGALFLPADWLGLRDLLVPSALAAALSAGSWALSRR